MNVQLKCSGQLRLHPDPSKLNVKIDVHRGYGPSAARCVENVNIQSKTHFLCLYTIQKVIAMMCLRWPPEIVSVIFPTNEMSSFTYMDFQSELSFYIDFRQDSYCSINLWQLDFLTSYEVKKSGHHEKIVKKSLCPKSIRIKKVSF